MKVLMGLWYFFQYPYETKLFHSNDVLKQRETFMPLWEGWREELKESKRQIKSKLFSK